LASTTNDGSQFATKQKTPIKQTKKRKEKERPTNKGRVCDSLLPISMTPRGEGEKNFSFHRIKEMALTNFWLALLIGQNSSTLGGEKKR
jgi:hypothetical protein